MNNNYNNNNENIIDFDIEVGFGGLKDLPDERDLRADVIGFAQEIALPQKYSLKNLQSPVKDQKKTNWCGAFAGVGILEYFHNLEFHEIKDFSETFLFKSIKNFDEKDYGYTGLGAYMRSVCKAMRHTGTIDEREGDFTNEEFRYKDVSYTDIDYFNAKYNTVKYFFKPEIENNVNEIKKYIVTYGPALCRIEISSDQIKQLKYSKYLSGKYGGYGHFVVVTGWENEYWEAKNSWGDKYHGGYIYVPIEWTKYLQFYFFTDNIMEKPFIDISENYKWAYAHLQKLKDAGIIQGYPSPEGQRLFDPNIKFTDGEKDNFIRTMVVLSKLYFK